MQSLPWCLRSLNSPAAWFTTKVHDTVISLWVAHVLYTALMITGNT